MINTILTAVLLGLSIAQPPQTKQFAVHGSNASTVTAIRDYALYPQFEGYTSELSRTPPQDWYLDFQSSQTFKFYWTNLMLKGDTLTQNDKDSLDFYFGTDMTSYYTSSYSFLCVTFDVKQFYYSDQYTVSKMGSPSYYLPTLVLDTWSNTSSMTSYFKATMRVNNASYGSAFSSGTVNLNSTTTSYPKSQLFTYVDEDLYLQSWNAEEPINQITIAVCLNSSRYSTTQASLDFIGLTTTGTGTTVSMPTNWYTGRPLYTPQSNTQAYNQGYNTGLTDTVTALSQTSGAMTNVFGVFTKAFDGMTNVLNIQVFGGITLGLLLGIPLVGLIVGVIFKLIKG